VPGFILKPHWVRGLTLTVDYWKTSKQDAIQLISASTMIGRAPMDFLARITRAALTPEDQALGYTGGVITQVDQTRIKCPPRPRPTAFDVQARYELDTRDAGQWTFNSKCHLHE